VGDAPTLESELESLLNRWSAENGSNTPDYILSEYMLTCLRAFNLGVKARDKWYGVELKPGWRGQLNLPLKLEDVPSAATKGEVQ